MACIKTLLSVGACMTAWSMTTGDTSVPKAQNVHWTSLDFQTILKWTVEESEHTYTVMYSEKDHNWMDVDNCFSMSETECDLTQQLEASNKNYEADIRADSDHLADEFGLDYDFPHTYAPMFNPYKESNISALEFSITDVDEGTVILNITHPLTSITVGGKQQTIKDILKNDLKYKIIYSKSGSTGEKYKIADSSSAEVSGLDAGQSYCFMVAAFIPSRPKATQLGAWSTQQCRRGDTHFTQDLSLGAWVGIIFILITVIIVFITTTILCCRRNHKRHKNIQTAESSAPI
ncbi:tissue factor-like isoform X1 [Xiphophorus maculatus]|uniref:Tissue factor n=1 Tax=Xiphophorus maculatus TaxID=8083 RepID=M3ZR78_XIPMA|nr:tissue factor-like isoform X1 [Xiphophorus maculatus]